MACLHETFVQIVAIVIKDIDLVGVTNPLEFPPPCIEVTSVNDGAVVAGVTSVDSSIL